MSFWDIQFLENTMRVWGFAVLVTAAILCLLWVVQRILIRRFYQFAKKTRNDVDNLVAEVALKTRFSIMMVIALYAGSLVLTLPANVSNWLGTITFTIFLIQVALWGDALIHHWLTRYQSLHIEEDADDVTTIRAISFVVRLALFSVIVLLALDNFPGIEVTSLIASLGIGGIAVALAVQNILADLFASLSIALDKPFVIGDFIIVGDYMGTVQNIGLKTTRIRSLSGEQLILSNNDLLNSRIRNYKRMEERRVVFSLGVTYQTKADQLQKVPEIIREIIEAQEPVRFDRAHFKEFDNFSLNFEIVYYVLNADYNLFMDIQQTINLAILQRFETEKIEFAYPTQTLFIEDNTNAAQMVPTLATHRKNDT